MPIYSGPNKEIPSYTTKFVRVEENIFITEPRDFETRHADLARQHQVFDRIQELKSTKPEMVDGGFINVGNRSIELLGRASSLGIPKNQEARTESVTIFQAKSPQYTVTEFKI